MSGTHPADRDPNAALRRARDVSRELAEVAAAADAARTTSLDAERRRLLESSRVDARPIDDEGRALLQEIFELNARSIGALEHRRRALARELDMAAAGSRALRAYAANGPRNP